MWTWVPDSSKVRYFWPTFLTKPQSAAHPTCKRQHIQVAKPPTRGHGTSGCLWVHNHHNHHLVDNVMCDMWQHAAHVGFGSPGKQAPTNQSITQGIGGAGPALQLQPRPHTIGYREERFRQWFYVPLCIYVPIGYVVIYLFLFMCVFIYLYVPFTVLTPTTFRPCLGRDSSSGRRWWWCSSMGTRANLLSSAAQEYKLNSMWRYHWFHPSNTMVHETRSMFLIVRWVLDVLGVLGGPRWCICSQ